MREHLEHLFGGFLDGFHDGLIELAWTDVTPNADGRYALRHASLFGTDQIDALIAEAVRLNRQTMCNVYVGAALRKPKTWPNARASAADVLALTCAYADLDDQGVASVARKRWGATAPTKIVITGREPYLRAQLWWRLDEPITDQKQSETLLKGIAAGMAGDTTVSDPPRVMRLAGSIAWPMKPDRKRPEITSIAHIKEEGQPIYTIEHLRRTFPFAVAPIEGVVTPDIDGIHHATTVLGLEGKVDDGRERYMLKTANAVLIELIGTTGIAPTAQELFDASWDQYQRGTDFTKPGRGADEYAAKCVHTVKRFLDGKIRGCETINVVQALYRQRAQARGNIPHNPTAEFAAAETKAKIDFALFEFLDIDQIMAMPNPTWLIDELINEQSLGFIFGPPGSLKTFIALDVVLSIAAKRVEWWGRTINQYGAVIYLCREGTRSLKFRIKAWELHRQTPVDGIPFYLIEKTINFMKAEDIGILLATLQTIAAKADKPIVAVVVDTVSRVLPGAKENLQEDMSLFVGACEAVQQRFNCVVIGVHHTNYAGGFRGSTVIPGAGDFLIKTQREPGAMTGSITIQKVKDGEDGKELPFQVVKVPLGDIVGRSSLVVDLTDQPPKKQGSTIWPDMNVCRQILAAIDEQWWAGKPWCFAKNTSRAAVTNIVKRWQVKREVAKDILDTWNANGVIAEQVYDPKNHLIGYRKLIDI
jgi:hypothetical protein